MWQAFLGHKAPLSGELTTRGCITSDENEVFNEQGYLIALQSFIGVRKSTDVQM